MLAAVAELERDLIRERTAAGLAAARARGRIGGAKQKITDDQMKVARQKLKQGAFLRDVAKEIGVSPQGLSKRIRVMDARKA